MGSRLAKLLSIATALALAGCPGTTRFDFDGDGAEDSADCAPEDPARYPGAPDPYSDGIDQDCDGSDGIDRDGDGYPANPELAGEDFFDCNDSNPNVHPGAEELLEDGFDNDCDGVEAVDEDNDGYQAGYQDCDDSDPLVHQDAPEAAQRPRRRLRRADRRGHAGGGRRRGRGVRGLGPGRRREPRLLRRGRAG